MDGAADTSDEEDGSDISEDQLDNDDDNLDKSDEENSKYEKKMLHLQRITNFSSDLNCFTSGLHRFYF